jgi:zinc transport system substrate-binding protein
MSRCIRAVLGLALFLLIPAQAAAADRLPVFVSIMPLKSFVEAVGGEHVDVAVMVGPGRSPATYEPTPKQMAKLASTRLYFRVGVPFEDVWIDRLMANNPDLTMIDLRDGLSLREFEADSPGEGHEDDGHGHGELDPHVWTSPPLVKTMAGRIRDVLKELDPGRGADYDAGYGRFAAELDSLDRDIRRILGAAASRRFMVFHPSWGYFAETYGLEQIPIEHQGKQPGAKRLAQIIRLAEQEKIGVIFVQEQFNTTTAESVAREIGARIVKVDPLAADYAANLRRTAAAFAEDLE